MGRSPVRVTDRHDAGLSGRPARAVALVVQWKLVTRSRELPNGDIKRHVAQANPGNVTELTAAATAHLRRRQNQPNVVKSLFRKPEVRYAAA
jgi:hypothetical protein